MRTFQFKYLLAILLSLIFYNSTCQERPKVGLVLSGGGASGLAHIGAIKIIEKAGIPIDYIAGSSMGSIIGALYSLGYTPDEMERMVMAQDWENLMSDQIPRADIAFEAKLELEKYFYSFPIDKSGIQLPSGLVSGHRITNLLANLTFSAYKIRDFNELPVPFLCIGADIETGEEVVLDSGVLHEALRASMAIPTLFTPVELNNRLLIDGGFINNFPADHVRKMGADIIIGIDVQRELYKKESLNSMVNIMKQASALTREEVNKNNREICDILLRPRTEESNTLSFGLAEEIITNAEKIAMEKWEALEDLGKKLSSYPNYDTKRRVIKKIDSVFVNEIKYEGLENTTEEFVWSKMDLPFPAYLTANQISQALQRLFGSYYFEKITYRLDSTPFGNRLTLKVVEKNKDRAHVGLHYDNLFNASLFLKTNSRNIWKHGDLLEFDLTLGENPHFGASYYFLTHKRQNFGIKTEYNRIVAYDYAEGERTGEYTYSDVILDLATRTSFNNVFSLSTGIQAELASVAPRINILDLSSFNSKMINVYTHLLKDSFNKSIYPTKGEKVEILAKLVTNFTSEELYPAFIFNYRHTMAFELGEKLSIHLGLSGGLALGDSIAYPYRSYVGGLGYYHKSIFTFVGLNYMEKAANHSLIGKMDLQYNFKGNHYVVWKNNTGKLFNNLNEFKKFSSTLFGTGLSYGYSTPFGPVEGTLMISSNTLKPLFFINIGYLIK